jgi:hypothetical protein
VCQWKFQLRNEISSVGEDALKLFGHRDPPLEEKNKRQFGYSRDNMAFCILEDSGQLVLKGLFVKLDITG